MDYVISTEIRKPERLSTTTPRRSFRNPVRQLPAKGHAAWTPDSFEATVGRPHMKALVVNAPGGGFDLEEIDIAAPIGREVLIDVRASGLCHTDLLFATHDIVPMPAVLGHEVAGIVAEIGADG